MAACGKSTGVGSISRTSLILIEMLSSLTKCTDLTEKRDNYSTILSLIEEVVVAQDKPCDTHLSSSYRLARGSAL